MISWLMIAQAIALGAIGAVVAAVGLARRPFNDWVLGAAALTLLTLVVGIGILACAVMVYRMHQIWFVQVA